MTAIVEARTESTRNPLDVVEELVVANEWTFQRNGSDEMSVEFPGHWCAYHLHFVWSEDLSAMHLSCFMDMKVPKARFAPVAELLTMINNKLWLGAFMLPEDETTPVFRHTLLLRGAQAAPVEALEDLVDIALTECERFYPSFQFVVWGGKTPADAIAASLLETVGEA
jgi:hypothetical protein